MNILCCMLVTLSLDFVHALYISDHHDTVLPHRPYEIRPAPPLLLQKAGSSMHPLAKTQTKKRGTKRCFFSLTTISFPCLRAFTQRIIIFSPTKTLRYLRCGCCLSPPPKSPKGDLQIYSSLFIDYRPLSCSFPDSHNQATCRARVLYQALLKADYQSCLLTSHPWRHS